MKMYLSSYKLGDHPEKFAELFGSSKKVAVIANSRDWSTDLERKRTGTEREIEELKRIGLEGIEVDLRDYFNKSQELSEKLNEFDGLWVLGGNTFILRKAFKESGLDNWLIENKNDKELVYGGYSAGVCVLQKSLKGIEITDDANASAEGYPNEILWDGVGLIDFVFAPHFESNHPESESMNKEIEYYQRNGIEYKALHDGEVLILE